MEQITENKYEKFYQDVKDFIIKTKLANIENINGVSENYIDIFEKEYDITLPIALRLFYYFFGETTVPYDFCQLQKSLFLNKN